MAVDGKHRQLVVKSNIVIAMCGLPGSGKSTLARALQDHTGWTRLDRDALRAELFADGGYADDDKAILNRIMRERMSACLTNTRSLILDGMTFSSASERAAFRSDAQAAGADWLLVWLDCPAATARQRVAGDRLHVAMDRTPELVSKVAQRFEAPRESLRLNALDSVPELLRRVLAALTPCSGSASSK